MSQKWLRCLEKSTDNLIIMVTVNKIIGKINELPSTDVYELLYLLDIEIHETDFLKNRKCDSQIISFGGVTGIYIKQELKEEYKQFLLLHELGHYLLHYDDNMNFNFYLSRYKSKLEVEANLFACIALLKKMNLSKNSSLINVLIQNGVPEQIAHYNADKIQINNTLYRFIELSII